MAPARRRGTTAVSPIEETAKGAGMKRDMDLVRRIALATTELAPDTVLSALDGVDEHVFVMHVQWMVEAGLLHAALAGGGGAAPAKFAAVYRLTWAGCEFADAVRSDTLWAKAKSNVIKPTASFTFDVLRDWLKTEITQGLPTLGRLAS